MVRSMVAAVLALMALSGCGVTQQTAASAGRQAPGLAAAAHHPARATGAAYTVTNTVKGQNWERLERLSSTYAAFPVEHARPNGRQSDSEIVAAFGTAKPPSSDVVLHYAKGWNTNAGTPVVLVHGAIEDATSSWIAPHNQVGLVQTLVSHGRRVFAVTFAHRHGDNMLQAQQLANAIARIREVTGAAQVDVVAHSKGTVVARALASNVLLPWMTPYQHDIRRMVLVGSPFLGTDYSFRHPLVNYGLFPELDMTLHDGPMSWTRMLYMGAWVDTADQTLMTDAGNYFPGQSQLLARFDQTYPLSQTEQDWYTTYNGGQGFVSVSEGIDKAIAQGGHFMAKLAQHPLDAGIQLAVIAGDSATMANILNETTGPSDGIVFVKSATATDDALRGGAKLIAKEVLHMNHMDLIIQDDSKNRIADLLARP